MELAELLVTHGIDSVIVGLAQRYSADVIDLSSILDELGSIVSLEVSEHISQNQNVLPIHDWHRKLSWSGGFKLEKCSYDFDIYNMLARSRPSKVVSFGSRKAIAPMNANDANTSNQIRYHKPSGWNAANDILNTDNDIIDFQTAIMQFESGAWMTFDTNLNVCEEQHRFCVMGTHGMVEGDFVQGHLKATARDGTVIASHDYRQIGEAKTIRHHAADYLMVDDIVAFLRGKNEGPSERVVGALEAGLVAMALDEARVGG